MRAGPLDWQRLPGDPRILLELRLLRAGAAEAVRSGEPVQAVARRYGIETKVVSEILVREAVMHSGALHSVWDGEPVHAALNRLGIEPASEGLDLARLLLERSAANGVAATAVRAGEDVGVVAERSDILTAYGVAALEYAALIQDNHQLVQQLADGEGANAVASEWGIETGYNKSRLAALADHPNPPAPAA